MKTRTLLDRVDASLAICAAAASASLAVVPSSDADIVYSGVVSINIPSTTAGIYLNVVTGVSGTTPAAVPGWDINPFSSTTFSLFNPATPTGGVYVGSSGFFILSLGIPISAASTPSPAGRSSASSPNPLTWYKSETTSSVSDSRMKRWEIRLDPDGFGFRSAPPRRVNIPAPFTITPTRITAARSLRLSRP